MPNTVLGLFGFSTTTEPWISVVAMLLLILSYYYIQTARNEDKAFFRLTVHGRASVIVFFGAFVLLNIAPAMLILFGVVDLLAAIWTALALPEEKIDILFFDLQEADPDILYEAVNNGVLLKSESPELLGESIEKLSLYLMQNEFIIARAKQLRHEQLEVFCAE